MLSFGNMPKYFLDTCERANIKFKKNQLIQTFGIYAQ
jgi:hypothetical protein